MKLEELTYIEKLKLRLLCDGPRPDRDAIEDRVLINSGLAERCDVGDMRITEAGRDLVARMSATAL